MTAKQKKKPVALITGGAKRIGKALALHLSKQGYTIALHCFSSKKEAAATANAILKQGGSCGIFCCNLADSASAQTLIKTVIETFGQLDVLINNASVFKPGCLKSSSVSDLDQSYAIHLRAPYILMQDFARLQKQGQIINILDTKISNITLTHVPYLLMKKALKDLTLMAAAELAPNFRVNGICPGPILAPEGKGQPYLKKIGKTVPLQTHGTVKDLCAAVDFLLQADYVTGQMLFEDGGAHLI